MYTLCFIACFKLSLFFVWASFSHSFLHPSCIIPLLISSFLSLLPLNCFVYSWQKRGEYIREYTGLHRHFYKTHVHTLRGSNSTSCTFEGREDILLRENLVLLYACFLVALWCFELCLVSSMLCCSHCIMLLCPSRILFLDAYTFYIECWTCMHLYAIVPFWLHVWMIICFTIWSL